MNLMCSNLHVRQINPTSWTFLHTLFLSIGSTGECVCQNMSECPADSAPLCVSSGADGVETTMSQCEFGARRCGAEQLNVTSIEACSQ